MCVFWVILYNMYSYVNRDIPRHPERNPEFTVKVTEKGLRSLFASCDDFQSRPLLISEDLHCTIMYFDGLVSSSQIGEAILRPLLNLRVHDMGEKEFIAYLLTGALFCPTAKIRDNADDVVSDLSRGYCALVFDGIEKALCLEAKSTNVRSVSSPELEKSLKGGRDSFVEILRTNTALVRRRIHSPRLKVVESTVGRKSKTAVSVLFIEGVADKEKVEELAKRLDGIDIDAVTTTMQLEGYIVDAKRSPFPQLLHTERPDRLAMYLLDGRIGILIDGIPVALVLPVSFAEFMRVLSDSNMNYIFATALTLLRYLALFIGLYLPAIYVSVVTCHREMIPSRLLLSIIAAKADVPFSPAVEIFGMLISFALLQEAGLRLPNPVGDTVSIIGALIVGQSAVDAHVASPIAIIVVAMSGIALYTMPSQDMGWALRICRLALFAGAVWAGLYGVGIVSIFLLLHLCSLESFGVNYTDPAGERPGGLLRLLVKLPAEDDKLRDPSLNTPDKRRQK